MSWAKIRGQLRSRVGCAVNFGPPQDVALAGGASAAGRIIDEVWVDEALNASAPSNGNAAADWGNYSFCAQLIEWTAGERAIRLAYYRRRVGEDWWELGSQTTVCAEPATIKRLCELTLGKTQWFDDLKR
jgi:hypothetical protein